MPGLIYLKQLWCSRYEKAKVIDHRLNIRLGVNYIFLVQSCSRIVKLTNQCDILNVQQEWS